MALVEPMQIILAGATGGLWSYAGMAGLALATSAVILAFVYLLGVMFRNQGLSANAKQELYEVLITAIMIVMIYGAVAALGTLRVDSFLPTAMIPLYTNTTTLVTAPLDPGTNVYDMTAKYFQQVDSDMAGWLEMNYVLNIYVDQIASITPYARPLGVGLVASPMAGIASPLKQLFYNMAVALSIAFLINYAQLLVYIFSLKGFLAYYLPLGMFLRAFTPTRRIGGTLIGIGFTFLFIFPALTCLTYALFYNPVSGPLMSFRTMATSYLSDTGFQNRFTDFMSHKDDPAIGTGMLDLITSAVGGIGTLLESVLGTSFLMLLIFPISVVAWAFTMGFILPAFNIIVLTQAAKVLSKSFGDEVDISSLTRMI
ncbi:hypothetical protein H0O00_02625 [Candidatus Micrarchaeota archaeon]|nr:hypothetical protein [Candidatus Micrarchaeota archaeon]